MHSRFSKFAAALCAGAVAIALGACSATTDGQPRETGTASVDDGNWPRTITDATDRSVKIPAQPERIVSTSVSVTGSLLALEAPVVASTTAPKSAATDGNGFFSQWSEAAADERVDPLFEIGKFDLDDIEDQDPDLIVVAATGADSELDNIAQLRTLAPTIVVDYASSDWTELSKKLGRATGTEEQAARNAAHIAERTAALKQKLAITEGTTASILSYNAHGFSSVAKSTGPHAALFEALGFRVPDLTNEFDVSTQAREDFSFTTYRDLPRAVVGDAIFLLSSEKTSLEEFTTDPTLASLPAIGSGDVFMLEGGYLLDFYSANNILDYFQEDFPGLNPRDLE